MGKETVQIEMLKGFPENVGPLQGVIQGVGSWQGARFFHYTNRDAEDKIRRSRPHYRKQDQYDQEDRGKYMNRKPEEILHHHLQILGRGYQAEYWELRTSQLAVPDNPRDPRNSDATFSEGLYGCDLPPSTPRSVLCANNYFDTLKRAGVNEDLLRKAINDGSNFPKKEQIKLEQEIKRERKDLWENTECFIEVRCPWAARAVLPHENGGANRRVLLFHCGREPVEFAFPYEFALPHDTALIDMIGSMKLL